MDVVVDDLWDWPAAVVNAESVMVGITVDDNSHAMKIAVWDWLIENVGPKKTIRQDGVWTHANQLNGTYLFRFQDPEKALLFKLTWG